MIADRWIGQRNAVVIGALSMSAGQALILLALLSEIDDDILIQINDIHVSILPFVAI